VPEFVPGATDTLKLVEGVGVPAEGVSEDESNAQTNGLEQLRFTAERNPFFADTVTVPDTVPEAGSDDAGSVIELARESVIVKSGVLLAVLPQPEIWCEPI